MPSREKLAEFTAWCAEHITGNKKDQAQIFLDRRFHAIGQSGCLDAGGHTEFRIRKDKEGGGTALADYVWKPVVLVEMKKRGENLQKHNRQAFDYWTRLAPARTALSGLLPRKIPFAGGLLRARSVGLSAFAVGKSFSHLPKLLKSQTGSSARRESARGRPHRARLSSPHRPRLQGQKGFARPTPRPEPASRRKD